MRALAPLVLAAALVMGGCDGSSTPPATPISDSLLVRALAEAHIASARASRYGENVDSLRLSAFAYLGVDSSAVSHALDVYAQRPAALAALYDRVTDYLREQQEAHDDERRGGPNALDRFHELREGPASAEEVPDITHDHIDALAHPDDWGDDR